MAPNTLAKPKKRAVKSRSASVANSAASVLADTKKKNSELKKKLEEALAAIETTRVSETDYTRRIANGSECAIFFERQQNRDIEEDIEEAKASLVALREAHEKVKKEKKKEEKIVAELKKEASTLGSKQEVKAVNADKKKVAELRKKMFAAQEALREAQEKKNGVSMPWKLCEICSSAYTKEALHCPRVLSCGHVLCGDCIKKMIKDDEIACPFGQEVIQITEDDVDKLPMDCLILQI